jgi:hypothetical protein
MAMTNHHGCSSQPELHAGSLLRTSVQVRPATGIDRLLTNSLGYFSSRRYLDEL